LKAARLFFFREKDQHSTYRELIGVQYALESFLPKIKFSHVKILVDNQAAVRIIDTGSMKEELHKFAMSVFNTCLHNSISLSVEWIPRELNEAADLASREAEVVDTDDWQISDEFFHILNNMWGPLTIDIFANSYNKKLERLFSLYHAPGSAGVDVFTHNWQGENCLLVPPVSIAGRALLHLKLCKARGVLIVCFWPSAHYWPMLLDDFSCFITDFLVLKGKKVLHHGFNSNSLLGSKEFEGNVLALYLDCS
jgi:hypothetical protein